MFSPTRTEGNLVFLSGQIGIKDRILVSEGIKEQLVQAVENVASLLKKHDLSLESVIDVTAFLVDQDDYQSFNEAYTELFKEPFPTRTTVTVKSLPFGARVELKVIARTLTASRYKLVVYVPLANADEMRKAIGEAGGGKLGNYSFCSFTSKGIGRFKPENGANPTIGQVGTLEEVEEERVEVLLDAEVVDTVITAMKKAHPYEEVAYDLYPVEVRE